MIEKKNDPQKPKLLSDIFKDDDALFCTLKRDIGMIHKLFDLDKNHINFPDLQNLFLEYIKETQCGPYYYTSLLSRLSKFRPHQSEVYLQLFDTTCNFFSRMEAEIRRYIFTTSSHHLLPFFNEKSIGDSIQDKVFYCIDKDDIDGLIDLLSKNPSFSLTEDKALEKNGTGSYYFFRFSSTSDSMEISLINFACLCGSLKCFKYLLLNNSTVSQSTRKYAIAGGNKEIINILKDAGHDFNSCFEMSVKYHRYDISDWLLVNYHCETVSLTSCFKYYNFDALVFYVRNGTKIDSNSNDLSVFQMSCIYGHFPLVEYLWPTMLDKSLAFAAEYGHLPIVKYLIKEHYCKNDNQALNTFQSLMKTCCIYGHFSIIKYLVDNKLVNVNKKDCGWAPIHVASQYGHLDIVKYLVEHDAHINAKTDKGFTPVYLAKHWKKAEVYQYLALHGGKEKMSDWKMPLAIFALLFNLSLAIYRIIQWVFS